MANQKVLLLGHSFVRRFKEYLQDNEVSVNLKDVDLHIHGRGGRTVPQVTRHDLHIVETVRPSIIILELGTNDLSNSSPERVAHHIRCLVATLLRKPSVKLVLINQVIHRRQQMNFNNKVDRLNSLLQRELPDNYRRHKGMWSDDNHLHRDGVHLSNQGQQKYLKSIRKTIIQAVNKLKRL